MQSNSKDNPAIEALRGIAALMVVTTHYAHLLTSHPGAWAFASTGVNLFFVLSGFVFAPYFFGKPLQVGPHLVRRIFRMYPLYLCALLTYVWLKEPQGIAWQYFGVHLLMVHTWQSQAIAFFYNPAFWSLPPEIEFYLLLPLLVLISRRTSLWLVMVLALASHVALVYTASPSEVGVTLRALATVHLPGILIEFMLGVLGFSMARRLQTIASSFSKLAIGSLGLLTWIAALWVFSHYLANGAQPNQPVPIWVGGHMGLLAATAYMFLVAAFAASVMSVPSVAMAVCFWAGRLSYGIYLFHYAALQVVTRYTPFTSGPAAVASALTLTVLTAWVVHQLVEAPCRNYGRKLSQALQK